MYSVQRDNADRGLKKQSKKVEKTMITKSVALKDQLYYQQRLLWYPKKFASWALASWLFVITQTQFTLPEQSDWCDNMPLCSYDYTFIQLRPSLTRA